MSNTHSKLRILWHISLFFLVALLWPSCGEPGRLDKGAPAPAFSQEALDGKSYQLKDHRGKVVMLYFWADWCPTCKKEFPQTEAFYRKLAGEDFELLAVNVAQPREASEKFQQKYEATFPMLLDPNSELTNLYEVEVLPTNYFIDPEGRVIRKIVGFVDENQARVMIEQHKK